MTRSGAVQSFERDGLVFDVVDEGPREGEVVVLLHGFPGGSPTWGPLARELAGSGFRTLAPDQRGYSSTALPSRVSAYRIEQLVADVLALADRAGAERFHVVGHDWGGVVAWHLAGRHPERVGTLTVLSTPHPRALTESMTRSLQPLRSSYALAWQLPVVPERLILAGGGRLMRAALERSGLHQACASTYVERMRRPGLLTGALNWYRAAGLAPRRVMDVPSIVVPTLYVWSTGDVALGRTAAERTARHVDGSYRFVVLDGVSHWIPETAAGRVADLFLSGVPVTAGSR